MISIYCIEDINHLKYIGSTSQSINQRFSKHKSDKRCGKTRCSSKGLDLEQSVIYEIDTCHKNDRTERERYWINEIDCVNKVKYQFNHNKSALEWARRNTDYVKKLHQINNPKRSQKYKIWEFLKMLDEY